MRAASRRAHAPQQTNDLPHLLIVERIEHHRLGVPERTQRRVAVAAPNPDPHGVLCGTSRLGFCTIVGLIVNRSRGDNALDTGWA